MIETIVAVAVASLTLAAVIGGVVAAAHRFGGDSITDALAARAQSELRVAVDALKYQGASLVPNTIATSVPLPGGSPIPAHVSLATTINADGSIAVTIRASADGRSLSAIATASIQKPAPAPSTTIPASSGGDAPI